MLVAKRENGEKVLATSELENTKDFICKFCGRRVVLKRGKIKSPHFAHKEKCECDYNEQLKEKCGGESELHYKWKNKIKKEMEQLSYVKEVLLEERIGNRIADIVVVFNDNIEDRFLEDEYFNTQILEKKRAIVEIQLSKISLEKIVERSKDYMKYDEYNDNNVFWLIGEKYKSIMGKYYRYITKDLTHYEFWSNTSKEDGQEESVIGVEEGEEWDIFTDTEGFGVVCCPSCFEGKIELKNFQSMLKTINNFSKKFREDKWRDNTIARLSWLMEKGIEYKVYGKEDDLLECRKKYIEQRRTYSKQYNISSCKIDELVSGIAESVVDLSKIFFTDLDSVWHSWFYYFEDDNYTKYEKDRRRIEKNGVLKIVKIIEQIEAIENNDTCKYIVDK